MLIAKSALIGLLLAAWWPHLLPAQPSGDDQAQALRAAASKGQTAQVKALLEKGVAVDSADKNGRTPLILAAQHGRADVVHLLLSKAANAGARDKSGFTAWGLATFSPAGHQSHQAALKELPQPARPRVAVNAGLTPVRLISSCFTSPGELRIGIDKVALDRIVLEQFQDFTTVSGKNLIEIVHATRRGMNGVLTADGVAPPEAADADAVVYIQVQPVASCSAGKDSLNLEIDVRVFRVRDRGLLFGKTFGGGIKGLPAVSVDNLMQYMPVYLNWIKQERESLYWPTVESLYRAAL